MTTYCDAEVHVAYDVLCGSNSASFSVFPPNRLFTVGAALPAGFFSALRASCQKGEKATVREGGGGADWEREGEEEEEEGCPQLKRHAALSL